MKVINGLHIAKHNGQLSGLILLNLPVDDFFLLDKLSSLSHQDTELSWFLLISLFAPSQCPLLLPPFLLTSLSWVDPMLLLFSFSAVLTPLVISASYVLNVIYLLQVSNFVSPIQTSVPNSKLMYSTPCRDIQQASQTQDSQN